MLSAKTKLRQQITGVPKLFFTYRVMFFEPSALSFSNASMSAKSQRTSFMGISGGGSLFVLFSSLASSAFFGLCLEYRRTESLIDLQLQAYLL